MRLKLSVMGVALLVAMVWAQTGIKDAINDACKWETIVPTRTVTGSEDIKLQPGLTQALTTKHARIGIAQNSAMPVLVDVRDTFKAAMLALEPDRRDPTVTFMVTTVVYAQVSPERDTRYWIPVYFPSRSMYTMNLAVSDGERCSVEVQACTTHTRP